MAKVELIEPRSFSYKLLTFYIVLLADIVTNCFTYYSELTLPSNHKYGNSQSVLIALVIFVVQVVLQIIIICWIFLLVWKTFLFKYGLIGILCSELHVLFITIPIHLVLFGAEKGLRFYYVTTNGAVTLWDSPAYEIVYWIRSLFMIYFYILLLNTSLDLADPKYYKSGRWLELNR
jgi:Transmembrane protein 138